MQFRDKAWYKISDGYNVVVVQYAEADKKFYPHAGWLAGCSDFKPLRLDTVQLSVEHKITKVEEIEL